MNKKVIYFGIFIILSTLIVTATFTLDKTKNKWQTTDSISSSQGSLQEAINNGIFNTGITSILDSSPINPGHTLSNIWVSVNGNEMNFADAIQNLDKLCGTTNPKTSYSNAPDPNHLGTEIEITTPYDGQTKSLQDAINDGSLVNVDGVWGDWSTCDLSTGFETKTCDNPTTVCNGLDCSGSSQQICGDWLINNQHTDVQCIIDGGTIYDLPEGKICSFGNVCADGWTTLPEFTSTYSRTCSWTGQCNQNSCTTGSHTQFQHLPTETCTYTQYNYDPGSCSPPYCSSWGMCGKWYAKYPCCKSYSRTCWGPSCDFRATLTCSAGLTEVGCY